MQRFRFELEPLLKFKQQLRKQVEMELYQRRIQLDAATAAVTKAKAELDQARQTTGPLEATTVCGLLAQARRCARCEQYLEQANSGLKLSRTAYEEAARRYRGIDKEIEALLALRNDQWRQHQRKQAGHGQRQLDEFVLRQWDQQRQQEQTAHG